MKTRQLLIVVMVLFASAVPVRADDHAASVDSLKNDAAQGEAMAQFALGVMYYAGRGVPQDYGLALKWYRLAAALGHANAQFNLGVMYAKGQGVPQDYVQAYKWLNLAAAAITEPYRDKAVKGRDLIAARMTPAQVAEA